MELSLSSSALVCGFNERIRRGCENTIGASSSGMSFDEIVSLVAVCTSFEITTMSTGTASSMGSCFFPSVWNSPPTFSVTSLVEL